MNQALTEPQKQALGPHVLVIDDEPDLRTLYELTLLREGYQVETASDLAETWPCLERRSFDAVITDMRLPDGTGMDVLAYLAQSQRRDRCIVMTAYGSAENAVESLKQGAFDYLTKPVDLRQFRAVVAAAIRGAGAERQQRFFGAGAKTQDLNSSAPSGQLSALDKLVGDSEPMQAVKNRIARIARTMAPVLVRGESGTGKELVANAIHGSSHRSDGPFVAVNCGAIPENLLEAEFFGAKKGSYTGATQDREGYFQAANGGTLFLDEIGDLPLAMQSKLLRVIQERCVRPLGSTGEQSVDARIVSATHKDLAQEVQAGRFRQDLYYRLNVIEILVPPLRQRRSDLPALCKALLSKVARDSGLPMPALSDHLLEQLNQHPLKGNVRELENLLHRALAMNDGSSLDLDNVCSGPEDVSADALLTTGLDLPAPDAAPLPVAPALPLVDPAQKGANIPDDLQAYLDQQEKRILERVLQETQYNRTAAATRLKLSLRQMRYRIARLNISMPHTGDGADEE